MSNITLAWIGLISSAVQVCIVIGERGRGAGSANMIAGLVAWAAFVALGIRIVIA